MRYRTLGQDGIEVSELCLGTMMFGGPTEESEAINMIHRAIDDGINFIDTANVYAQGNAERIVGKAIRDRRDNVVIATKIGEVVDSGPHGSGAGREHLIREIERSLKRLGLDYVDLLYLHQYDYDTSLEESIQALDTLTRQGKVRTIGCSNFYAYQVTQGLWLADRHDLAKFTSIQLRYNIVNRDPEVELLPMCQAYGVGVTVYSPLARGVLTGKYSMGQKAPEGSRLARDDVRLRQTELREESFHVTQQLKARAEERGVPLSQFALAWVLANSLVTSVVIGPRTIQQYEDNVAALHCSITDDDELAVDSLVPPGEHTGRGYHDPKYPVRGRLRPAYTSWTAERVRSGDQIVAATQYQISSPLAGEVMVMSLKSGLYARLDPVGARIWELLQKPKTVNAIRDILLEEYDVENEQCEADLFDLLKRLVVDGFVDVKPEIPGR